MKKGEYLELCDLMLNFVMVLKGIALQMKNEPDEIEGLIGKMEHRCIETERVLKVFKKAINGS